MNIKHRPKSLRLSGLTDMCGKVSVYLRKLGMAVSSLKMKKKGEGQVSSFQALMNTISSTVGMGNIAGVAIALCVGGYALTFPHGLRR